MNVRRVNLRSLLVAGVIAVSGTLAGLGEATPQDRPTSGTWTILRCGTLIDVPGQPVRSDMAVVVRNDRIEHVLPYMHVDRLIRDLNIENHREVDLSAHSVLPGLIDCHTHITHELGPDNRLQSVTESEADVAIRATVFARRTVQAGFTTIRNVGSSGDTAFALRDAIARGMVPGPRILVAGNGISPTGGHGDRTHGYKAGLLEFPTPWEGIADGADACRQAVRHQVRRGADVIKFTSTGGVLSSTAAGTDQQFFADEIEAIVDTAHMLGRTVAAHAHGTDGINAALRAGVDSIEHGSYLDDESIKLFTETGAFLVPTLLAGATVTKIASETNQFDQAIRDKALRIGPIIQDSMRRANDAGVRIAFGTDSGVSRHGDNALEFQLMQDAGMSAEACVIAATINAAELCGLSDEIGTIETGKVADIIAVRGDPLTDASVLERVAFVMKSGRPMTR